MFSWEKITTLLYQVVMGTSAVLDYFYNKREMEKEKEKREQAQQAVVEQTDRALAAEERVRRTEVEIGNERAEKETWRQRAKKAEERLARVTRDLKKKKKGGG